MSRKAFLGADLARARQREACTSSGLARRLGAVHQRACGGFSRVLEHVTCPARWESAPAISPAPLRRAVGGQPEVDPGEVVRERRAGGGRGRGSNLLILMRMTFRVARYRMR